MLSSLSELEKEFIRIRAVDGNVTERAGLILLRLIVERRNSRSHRIHGKRVAFQTEQVDLAAPQQLWVRGTMRRMACDASFDLDWNVLEHEWSRLFRVAVEADLVLSRGGTQLPGKESSMRIMAIAAGDEPFVDAVVIGFGEIRLYFKMAAIT